MSSTDSIKKDNDLIIFVDVSYSFFGPSGYKTG